MNMFSSYLGHLWQPTGATDLIYCANLCCLLTQHEFYMEHYRTLIAKTSLN
jgi:hypothetical protein